MGRRQVNRFEKCQPSNHRAMKRHEEHLVVLRPCYPVVLKIRGSSRCSRYVIIAAAQCLLRARTKRRAGNRKKSRSVRRVDIERAARAREDERKGKEAKEEKKGSISEKLVSRNHYTFCGSSRWFSFSRRLRYHGLEYSLGSHRGREGEGGIIGRI